jgi:hypothetical protein
MSGGTITGNSSAGGGGGVDVVRSSSNTFAMSNDARIDASNEVRLGYAPVWDGSSYVSYYATITITDDFSGSDTIAVIDLYGAASDWLLQPVLRRDAEYTGTIPVSRFGLGNFVDYVSKTPITNYVINSEGKLVNK